MTQEQIDHANGLAEDFRRALQWKYRKGVEEHGGNIWDMSPLSLIDEAIKENVDQFTYLMTARQNLLKTMGCDRTGGCLKVNTRNPKSSCKCDPYGE